MLEVSDTTINTFEGKTLEEVYENATHSLNCSITDLDIEITQVPSQGFFGFFIKKAKIAVKRKKQKSPEPIVSASNKEKIHIETLSSRLKALNEETKKNTEIPAMSKQLKKEKLFNQFYSSSSEDLYTTKTEDESKNLIVSEIKNEINKLFSMLSYEIDEIEVQIMDDEKTIYIQFSGKDSALLIGKEGYRYKALSYVLFNWINEKYNMMVRLEIAQFLQKQEETILNYLEPVILTVKKDGYFKTKILDGILVHIALSKLREEFPSKYVAVKTTQKGEKYILINEYRN